MNNIPAAVAASEFGMSRCNAVGGSREKYTRARNERHGAEDKMACRQNGLTWSRRRSISWGVGNAWDTARARMLSLRSGSKLQGESFQGELLLNIAAAEVLEFDQPAAGLLEPLEGNRLRDFFQLGPDVFVDRHFG